MKVMPHFRPCPAAAFRLVVLAAPLLMPVAPAAGQPAASPPAQQNALIRAWPDAGPWRVLLVRTRALDGAPSCLLMTGYASAGTPGYRIWGVRWGGGRMWLIMNARHDMPAAEIGLFANGRRVVAVPVTERPASLGDVSSAVSLIDDEQSRALVLDALHGAGTLGLSVGTVAATETSDPVAVRNFDECRRSGAIG